MVDVAVNNGTVVSVSANLPATYDNAGYTDVGVVYTTLGEVVDVGEIAKSFTTVTHQPLDQDYPDKLKDVYDIGDVTITLGKVDSDAGQVLLQTALASDASYTFKVAMASGAAAYITAKVLKAGLGAISSGGISTTSVSLAVDPESLFEE